MYTGDLGLSGARRWGKTVCPNCHALLHRTNLR